MSVKLDQLQDKLAYRFNDPSLLRQALTHRSAGKPNNERLEFLGDALLDFIIGELLFAAFPDASEGDLTRMRAAVVNKATLAGLARDLEIGEAVFLGAGEANSGGKKRESILADTLEAIIAAIYLDSSIGSCEQFISRITTELIENPQRQRRKDYKTQLQELMQAQGEPLPTYELLETSGQAHAQKFLVLCQTTVHADGQRGRGNSKRAAEQEAAKNMLNALDANE